MSLATWKDEFYPVEATDAQRKKPETSAPATTSTKL